MEIYLIATVLVIYSICQIVNAQDCQWSEINSKHGDIQSVSSPGNFSVNINFPSAPVVTNLFSWKIDSVSVLDFRFDSGKFTQTFNKEGFSGSLFQPNDTSLTSKLNVDQLLDDYNGKLLTATYGPCNFLPSKLANMTLTVTNCTSSSEGLINGRLQDNEVTCNYQCTAVVQCNSSYSLLGDATTCQADATWSPDCTQTTTVRLTTTTISSATGQSPVSKETTVSNDISSTTSDNSTGGNKGTPENNEGLSDGAIAGIVIAVVVVVGAAVAGIVIYFKKSGYIPGSAK